MYASKEGTETIEKRCLSVSLQEVRHVEKQHKDEEALNAMS